MKVWLSKVLKGFFLFVSLIVLFLTNVGIISFKELYIYQLSEEMPAIEPVVAFENVNLIPMDSERAIDKQTVIVRDGVIEAIGDADQISIPSDATVIEGAGKYLMPGLVDMHVHIEYENDALLFLANGVTSVRNMWGNTGKKLFFSMADQLALRQGIENGDLFGPTIYTAGPVMEGKPAFHPMVEGLSSVQDAAESVAWQIDQGYDFIKVYDHVSSDAYQAILDVALESGVPVVGHVPFAVGIDGVLSGGQQTIEHLTGYIDPDAVEFIIPEDELEEYAARTREAGVWNCVTLSVYPKSKETTAGVEGLQNQAAMKYLSPTLRLLTPFFYSQAAKAHTYQGADYPQRLADLNRQMVQALHEAGAGILLGTDAAQPYHIPGFSIHEELAMLVEAGLSSYEALVAGTRDAAAALGKLDEFGTIEVGKRADLILLESNPLVDVSNVIERSGVMVRGRWMDEAQLQSMLASLAESYQPAIVDRIWPLLLVSASIFLIVRKSDG